MVKNPIYEFVIKNLSPEPTNDNHNPTSSLRKKARDLKDMLESARVEPRFEGEDVSNDRPVYRYELILTLKELEKDPLMQLQKVLTHTSSSFQKTGFISEISKYSRPNVYLNYFPTLSGLKYPKVGFDLPLPFTSEAEADRQINRAWRQFNFQISDTRKSIDETIKLYEDESKQMAQHLKRFALLPEYKK